MVLNCETHLEFSYEKKLHKNLSVIYSYCDQTAPSFLRSAESYLQYHTLDLR